MLGSKVLYKGIDVTSISAYILEDIKYLYETAQSNHDITITGIGILIAIGAVLLIVGIAILINQRKIKKQLKKLLEEKDKP